MPSRMASELPSHCVAVMFCWIVPWRTARDRDDDRLTCRFDTFCVPSPLGLASHEIGVGVERVSKSESVNGPRSPAAPVLCHSVLCAIPILPALPRTLPLKRIVPIAHKQVLIEECGARRLDDMAARDCIHWIRASCGGVGPMQGLVDGLLEMSRFHTPISIGKRSSSALRAGGREGLRKREPDRETVRTSAFQYGVVVHRGYPCLLLRLCALDPDVEL